MSISLVRIVCGRRTERRDYIHQSCDRAPAQTIHEWLLLLQGRGRMAYEQVNSVSPGEASSTALRPAKLRELAESSLRLVHLPLLSNLTI